MSRVTVIMPVHNAASYLQAAIDSVLLQDAPDFKLLIIDDGSDDRSREILELQSDPRVEVVFRPRSGLGAVLNYGINECTTPYVARMDADDLCAPGRLRLQLEFLESHPDVGAVGTQFIYFADNGRSLPSPRLPLAHDEITRLLSNGNLALVHASLVFRTEALRAVGGYRISGIGEDWDLFLRLGETTRLANLESRLYRWRIHPGNINLKKIATEQRGIRYARYCARRRQARLSEPDLQSFSMRAEPVLERLQQFCKSLSLVHYRLALRSFGRGSGLQGGLHLTIASVLAPQRSIRRIAQMVRRPRTPGLA